jgi:serine/threonine protein phosphatase 1
MSKPLGPQSLELAAALNEKLPLAHYEFLKNCALSHEIGDYLFVHAGIKPKVKMKKQKQFDLTMIRKGFLDSDVMHEKRVVHGHSSVKTIDIRPNRINVDTGLYYGRHLTAAVLEGTDVGSIEVAMIERDV